VAPSAVLPPLALSAGQPPVGRPLAERLLAERLLAGRPG
jgi:hypothetical protein